MNDLIKEARELSGKDIPVPWWYADFVQRLADALEKAEAELSAYKEANPPKHGEWERVIPTKSAAKWSTKVCCSVCHRSGYTRYNFCSNCGADMREEK